MSIFRQFYASVFLCVILSTYKTILPLKADVVKFYSEFKEKSCMQYKKLHLMNKKHNRKKIITLSNFCTICTLINKIKTLHFSNIIIVPKKLICILTVKSIRIAINFFNAASYCSKLRYLLWFIVTHYGHVMMSKCIISVFYYHY